MAKKPKTPATDEKLIEDDEKLIEEVKTRFERCEDFEAETRPLWRADLRFANGDPDNGWQWEAAMRSKRTSEDRPCLTINKVKQHNRQITNDARQNKPAIRVSPVDSKADKKTAEILNGVIRHIEKNSSADTAYDTAFEHAVDAGLGYWRVVTDYASDDSFDQEIFIKRVKNPLNIYLDPDIQEADGSDARFGFAFKDMPKDEFEQKYPNAEAIGWPLEGGDSWLTKDNIRVAEYFKKVETKDTLYADENGNTVFASDMGEAEAKQAKEAGWKSRSVMKCQIKWYLIAGDQKLEEKDWSGKYIPIVRVVGDEVEVDGKIDRKGHTRQMKDAQRMYNYNSSASVEYGALQTKVPWVLPAESIEGYTEYWETANTSNHSYLPWNHLDAEGNPLPAPQRPAPPTPAMLFIEGMRTASEEMKMASGQYDEAMGKSGDATSGRQEIARQRKGEVATFHFVDNEARAIKYTGKILVDLIPKIYDTARVIRIIGEDGKEDQATIDPGIEQAYLKRPNPTTSKVEEIYNPGVGRYDVDVLVGPSYSTKRQEAFAAMTEMSSRNPQLLQVAGDLIMKAADFPMAEQLAERLEKTIPPELMKDDENADIPPQVQAKMQQMEQVLQQNEMQMQEMGAELQSKHIEAEKVAIDRMNAETNRMKAEGELQIKAMTLNQPAAPTVEPDVTEAEKLHFEAELKIRLKQMDIDAAREMELMKQGASAPEAQQEVQMANQQVMESIGVLADGVNQLQALMKAPRKRTPIYDPATGKMVAARDEIVLEQLNEGQ